MDAYLLETSDDRWVDLLGAVRHDIYHLPQYAEFAARRQVQGHPVAFVAEADSKVFLLPLIMRSVPLSPSGGERLCDASSPRGYPGPIHNASGGVSDSGFVDRALHSMHHLLERSGVVSVFVRLHPLLAGDIGPYARAGDLVRHPSTVSIDLRSTDEALWRAMRENHRRDIRRAEERGYVARIDSGWDRFEDFIEAYANAMDRLHASAHLRHDAQYLADLRQSMEGRLHLGVVELGGEFAAGCLLSEADGIVEYQLACTVPRHIPSSPSKLLIRFIARWARARGNATFHLAGSPSHNDSVYHFKSGFSGDTHPLYTWRLVVDQDKYDELTLATRASHAMGQRQGSYFPAYRAETPISS